MKKKKSCFLICMMFITCSFFTINSININEYQTDNIAELNNLLLSPISNLTTKFDNIVNISLKKSQLSFAAFTDTHIGVKYQYPYYGIADHLDLIGRDLVDSTNLLDFAIHLGDIVSHNTNQVNGLDLPWYVNQYKNNLKTYLISNINLPFYCVIGNHDIDDYQKNCDNPHNLTKSLIDELFMNNPVYAMMLDGILFLIIPELGYVQWTHPVEYEWIEYMTKLYHNITTIIFCHQTIEDTTKKYDYIPYRAKQDINWWINLFRNNPQIKMWIHGHNHYLDWYVNNQSNGYTKPIQEFGHEMVFSSPYPQLDFKNYYEEDRVVIYNITSTGINTATWENNGKGGHWVSDYAHSWNIPTTFDPNTTNWYSFPMFIQDNETQLTDMKLLSSNITLQLIGTVPMELFYDARMESPSSRDNLEEIILGFGNDKSGNVIWTNPGMKVCGPTFITFPEKYPFKNNPQEDGRSGQPYHSFPMGTICAAVPGQKYNFTITAKCYSGNGKFKMNVSCSNWKTKSQYSELNKSNNQVFSHTFGSEYETIYGQYTVPNNENAWFLQGKLEFLDPTDYDVSLFSVKRQRESEITNNFRLCLSGKWYNVSGLLAEDENINFPVDPSVLCDKLGVINFTAFIDGNKFGMVNLIYYEPLLMSMNARFRVNSYVDGVFNISLTKTISRNSPVKDIIWNSKLFQKFPRFTELITRFLLKGLTSKILRLIFNKTISQISTTFKMYPFSTDSLYEQVEIKADDGSEKKHMSKNGNLWFSCNCPIIENRYVDVKLQNIQ